ncbi:uncharacterized protein [Ptychodera flava]|uniref:uncharacterized protein n=1 Tax=Ptychodera flava TaxID=63121 RepID=UPI00396A31A3
MADGRAGDKCTGDETEVRSHMKDFWTAYSKDATVESMMHDTKASTLTEMESKEIMSMLPNIEGKRILELGAGIGRQTKLFAEKAAHVSAVDFMETFVEKNRQNNSHLENVEFIQADITKLDLPEESYDIVFSNWLMMYLSDDEVLKLFTNTLKWLKEGGFVFFRESCFGKAGDFDHGEDNPTFYRLPSQYNALFHSAFLPCGKDGDESHGFEIIFSKTVQTYVKVKQNRTQICWLLRKKRIAEYHHGYTTFQAFLDNQQYAKKSILQYERMFGEGSISPGGLERAKECIKMLALKPGQKVLDVGCGIGGAAFHMTETYGVEVLGVDLSSNMIEIAMERTVAKTDNPQVQFEVCDVTRRDFHADAFDVIYSSHIIVHVVDKLSLFGSFVKWTKPGGKLLISDYYCGNPDDHSEDFKEYVKQRGYTICTTAKFGKLLSSAGFVNVKVEDRTKQLIEVLRREKKQLQEKKDSFVKDFSVEEYQNILSSWDNKLKWSDAGHLRLGVFYAEKPE